MDLILFDELSAHFTKDTMAQADVGPNDIVIHLVNPYKCGVCGLEFLTRQLMLVRHILVALLFLVTITNYYFLKIR